MMRRAFAFYVAFVLAAMVAACPAGAQTPSPTQERDSLIAFLDSAHARLDSLDRQLDSIVRSPPRPDDRLPNLMMTPQFPTETYATALALGLAANAVWKIDRDPGGYPDKWTTMDKAVHLNVAHFLTARAMKMGVHPAWAFGLTCAAAVGFERTQGSMSGKDIAVGCAGSALALVERALWRKVRE